MSPDLPEALQVALRVIDVLDELGIRYHVGGSYASSIHGIPRQTQDIDLVVELPSEAAGPLTSTLGDAFYADEESARGAVRDKTSGNVIHLESGIKVDLFVRGDAPFDLEEFRRHRRELIRRDPERYVDVKTAEDILLRELSWYRMGGETSDRQWNHVLGIVRTHGEALDREYLARWGRELAVEDLLDSPRRSVVGRRAGSEPPTRRGQRRDQRKSAAATDAAHSRPLRCEAVGTGSAA